MFRSAIEQEGRHDQPIRTAVSGVRAIIDCPPGDPIPHARRVRVTDADGGSPDFDDAMLWLFAKHRLQAHVGAGDVADSAVRATDHRCLAAPDHERVHESAGTGKQRQEA